MKLWLITSIRMNERRGLPAPALQNLRTAEALARAGHRVLVWVAESAKGDAPEKSGDCAAQFEAAFGRRPPEGLLFLSYAPHGPRDDKKTPFARKWDRWRNPRRAANLLGGAPDAIVSRSPLALAQLRAAGAGSASWESIKLVLEWQYPEHMQLWRGWRKRNAAAPMKACVARLRAWRDREFAQIECADGILYAADDHERLLRAAGFQGAAAMLHSACEIPADAANAHVDATFDFGYVGALAPENGVETLIAALAKLKTGRLLVVGGAAEAYVERLKKLAAELNVASRVEFAGQSPANEIADRMRACRVGVSPFERRCGPEKRQFASPLKLIEWMGAGVPVIAGDVPSAANRATHGKDAWFFKAGDADALAAAMERLDADDALRARLASGGLAHAREHTFAKRAARIAEFIEGLG